MSNSVVRRKYYAIEIVLQSPLSVSGGADEYTDSDVLRNADGEVFVPGTSLAGAFRNYLNLKKSEDGIFGYSDGEKGRMSPVYVSDLTFTQAPAVTVRDGVQLGKDKTVQNKFDMEIIETGAKGIFYLSYLKREADMDTDFESIIADIFQGIVNGEIRFGANKTRGFGRLKISRIYQQEFGREDVEDWLIFAPQVKNVSAYKMAQSFKEWAVGRDAPRARYIKMRIPLRLTGGISIRKYSSQPQKADFEHITCNQKPIIPGTSWNGAIRSDAASILNDLGCANIQSKLNRWFGHIEESNSGKKSEQSMVIVGESVIEGARALPVTRNKINRFSAATINGALYSEVAYFGGETVLELMVKKDDDGDYLSLLGILMLVTEDIQNGYVAVGGQTAIGRGIFAEDKNRSIQYSEPVSEEACLSALYSML